MDEERRRILDLLAQGKITVEQADQLLAAIGHSQQQKRADAGGVKFVRVEVHKAANQWRPEKQVSIKIPIALARSGMNFGAMIQGFGNSGLQELLRARGIDLSKLDQAKLEEVLKDMGELTLDVDQGRTQVRITCE